MQILDPAAGTGTFLAAIVQHIHQNRPDGQQGVWTEYVQEDLIPRLNGFEVLMAPYTMAHTKLEMVLNETGCQLNSQRLRVFLTNTLENHNPDTDLLFTEWLTDEANEANYIKRDVPVMVVIGNPPYSGESANKGEWIAGLLHDYKQEPDGGRLNEKNPKWINDDYVKFIRYGQHRVDNTGTGVLAYINNHSFLDNPTFRGMRWSLLQSFDKIYIIDLHGNIKKKETAPDGSEDKNVFDIQQGVAINLFVKTGKKKKKALAQVFHRDIYGLRDSKYEFLWNTILVPEDFEELKPQAPQYFFVAKEHALQGKYEKGFSVKKLFSENSASIITARDKFTLYYTPQDLRAAIADFRTISDETARQRYSLGKDTRDWKINLARQDLEEKVFSNHNDNPVSVSYRPFDFRYTYYTGKTKGFHCMPRKEIMRHFVSRENIGLITTREQKAGDFDSLFVSKHLVDAHIVDNLAYFFPLYVYPETNLPNLEGKRRPNLDHDIVQTIANRLGLRFIPEKEHNSEIFAPIDLLDYIYAVLHSPVYREHYNEFLKIDFPYVPYPANKKQFRKLATLGGELRLLHLLESPKLNTLITKYPVSGDHLIDKLKYEITNPEKHLGAVQINKTQYFSDVPEIAWNFHIGSRKPAQTYLKNRKNRNLTSDEINHYQKIIIALTETNRLMEEIDRYL